MHQIAFGGRANPGFTAPHAGSLAVLGEERGGEKGIREEKGRAGDGKGRDV